MIGVCQNNPCKNGGTCTLVNGSPKCTCISGLTGVTCEKSKTVLDIFRFLFAKSSVQPVRAYRSILYSLLKHAEIIQFHGI